ncbi:MAG TPA: XRE family transcriptional regulator, partial [Rhodobiaceae bacterium]|nr:XRE family transcriptional regulator [Rhodobiaceae bacterium]
DISHARDFAYSLGHDLDNEEAATPIGVNCRLCERLDCSQRAFPPLKRKLHVEEHVRSVSAFGAPSDGAD